MKKKKLNCAIIGCGLLGLRRAEYIKNSVNIIACCDDNNKKLNNFKKKYCNLAFKNWKKIFEIKNIDFVIISTPHYLLSKIAIFALKKKIHVFIEKPGGINSFELKEIIILQKKFKKNVYIAYNHIYHPSIIKSKNIIENGDIGKILYIRARYGHGGRLGYEKEWRAKPEQSGGGEIIDQGSHLINLSIYFLGKLNKVQSYLSTFFWNMKVEDNGFLILRNNENQVSFIHASCTEWKNKFSFEIFGKLGKLEVSGLGGSYGTEKLTFYKMLKKMGPPEIYKWNFKNKDRSWKIEINNFLEHINNKTYDNKNLINAYETIKIISKVYKQNKYDYSKKST